MRSTTCSVLLSFSLPSGRVPVCVLRRRASEGREGTDRQQTDRQADRQTRAVPLTLTVPLTRTLHRAQPGVDDDEIKQLVEDKVDAFWRGVEGDANKRGQVRVCSISIPAMGHGPPQSPFPLPLPFLLSSHLAASIPATSHLIIICRSLLTQSHPVPYRPILPYVHTRVTVHAPCFGRRCRACGRFRAVWNRHWIVDSGQWTVD